MRSQRRRQRQQSGSGAGFSDRGGVSLSDWGHFWSIAYVSAKEVDSHLRLLERAGVVNTGKAERVLASLDQVRAMTWRLINPNT